MHTHIGLESLYIHTYVNSCIACIHTCKHMHALMQEADVGCNGEIMSIKHETYTIFN
jgi:hypothetical protein